MKPIIFQIIFLVGFISGIALIVGCGSGSNQGGAPDISGNYSGTMTVISDGCGLGMSGTSSDTEKFQQNGTSISDPTLNAENLFAGNNCITVINSTPLEGIVSDSGDFTMTATANLHSSCNQASYSVSFNEYGTYSNGEITANASFTITTVGVGSCTESFSFSVQKE